MSPAHLETDLELPLSKNTTKEYKIVWHNRIKRAMRTKVNKEQVLNYRIYVNGVIRRELKDQRIVFKDKVWTTLSFWWRKRNSDQDHHNFHQEICDALQTPLGVNDRYFLLRDMEVTIDKNNPGVMVRIDQT